MEDRLQKILSSPKAARRDIIAPTFFAAIEADIMVAASMGGVHGALAYLNARTRYRFTGIYPLESLARFSAHLYDRDTPAIAPADDGDLSQVALAIGRAERLIASGPRSPKLDDIPVSAIGAPLVASDGTTWGVLCHFDPRLRTMPDSEAHVLKYLGARAAQWLEPRLIVPTADQPVEV